MMIAYAHKVTLVVTSAVPCRYSVMNHINRNIPPIFKTLLTKRVRFYITLPYLTPLVPVTLIRIRVTAVMIILKVSLAFMVVAVVTVGQVRATGIGTGLFRFVRHTDSKIKALAVTRKGYVFTFLQL
jgi:hypothetical protein